MAQLSGAPNLEHLQDSQGLSYGNFRKSLHIKSHILLLNILLSLSMISLPFMVLASLSDNFVAYLLILPASLWVSYWMHAYTAHFHEAAHFNIHHSKKINDWLADVFLTPFVGLWIKDYRVSHWRHHLFLGLKEDTETSYRSSIKLWGMVESLTGIYLIKTALRYLTNFQKIDTSVTNRQKYGKIAADRELKTGGVRPSARNFLWSISCMLTTQLIVALFLYHFVSIPASITWLLSFFSVTPFIAKIRQTLEHRALDADRETDYNSVEHGPINRMFGTDFFSRNFGGAGFNRHLLHHYDPTISYTCFDELEQYLLDTPIRKEIEDSKTTYWRTLMALLRQ